MAVENFALPLFSLVDQRKVDSSSSQLPELAEQLGAFLESRHGIRALDWRIEVMEAQPYLIMNAVAEESLPRLFALADVQHAQLFKYRRESAGQALLVPVAIDPG